MIELEAGGSPGSASAPSTTSSSARSGMELHHGGVLRHPLTMPLGAIALAAHRVRPGAPDGRRGSLPRPAPHQLHAVVPREQGVEGWLWTAARRLRVPARCATRTRRPTSRSCSPIRSARTPSTAASPGVRAGARRPLGARQPGRLRPADARPRRAAGGAHLHASSASPSRSPTRRSPPTLRRALPTDVSADPTVRSRTAPARRTRSPRPASASSATVKGRWSSASPQTTAAAPAAAPVRSSPTSADPRAP